MEAIAEMLKYGIVISGCVEQGKLVLHVLLKSGKVAELVVPA